MRFGRSRALLNQSSLLPRLTPVNNHLRIFLCDLCALLFNPSFAFGFSSFPSFPSVENFPRLFFAFFCSICICLFCSLVAMATRYGCCLGAAPNFLRPSEIPYLYFNVPRHKRSAARRR